MSPLATFLWLCNLAADTAGQLFFKAAAVSAKDKVGFARWKSMAMNRWIWLGVTSYVSEFFLWLAFLSLVPLSQAVLMGSVNIATVMIAGRLFFNEPLTPQRNLATVLIGVGVVLVGWS